MKLPKVGCAVLAVLAAALILWQAVDVRTPVLLSQPSGSITSGSLLGVSIGDGADQAITRLRSLGFEPPKFYPGGGNLYLGGRMEDPNNHDDFIIIHSTQTVVRLDDDSWRNGRVEFVVEDDRVVRISWSYGGPLMALIW